MQSIIQSSSEIKLYLFSIKLILNKLKHSTLRNTEIQIESKIEHHSKKIMNYCINRKHLYCNNRIHFTAQNYIEDTTIQR